MQEIEGLAKTHASAHSELREYAMGVQRKIDDVLRLHRKALERRVNDARETEEALRTAVSASKELFEKPRTRTFFGIKLGFVKAKGKTSFANDDADTVVRRVRNLFPTQFDQLVKTTYSPIKDALSALPAADLKRLGVTVTGDGDAVVVKPVDGVVAKLIAALLGEPEAETEAAGADA